VNNAVVGAASFSAAVNALPTAAAVAILCVAVVTEIVVVPAVLLPGGTMTLLAGALIGSGRPALEIAVPVILAVVLGDQVAYFCGALVVGWWRSRRPGRTDRASAPRRGQAAKWLTATMPSLAGAARMPYREFAPRLLTMRVPWLAVAFTAGTLAAHSLREIGHVAGVAGVVASALVVVALFVMRKRPSALREILRCRPGFPRRH